jgi:transcriptional regulator with XRE-family HTH domain
MTNRPESAERLHVSRAALRAANLPRHIRAGIPNLNTRNLAERVAVLCASEALSPRGDKPVDRRPGSVTRYLVLVDVPEPALVRLPRTLGVHRPDYRLYLTRDAGTVRRLLIGLARRQPVLGIVDAYLLSSDLHVLTADFEVRCFPVRKVPLLAGLSAAERGEFSVDEDGSYLHWPARDLHIGVSQLLQEVDPAYMTDIAIERNAYDKAGAALRIMREARALRQSDIPGISVRQVSRVEQGVSRLRYESAQKFASAFGMDTSNFLDELGRRAAALHNDSDLIPPQRLKRTDPAAAPAGSRT